MASFVILKYNLTAMALKSRYIINRKCSFQLIIQIQNICIIQTSILSDKLSKPLTIKKKITKKVASVVNSSRGTSLTGGPKFLYEEIILLKNYNSCLTKLLINISAVLHNL